MQNQTLNGMNFLIGAENTAKSNPKQYIDEDNQEGEESYSPFQNHHIKIKVNKQLLAQSNQGALNQGNNMVRLPSIARLSLNNSPFDEANYNYVLRDQILNKKQSNLDTYHQLKQK